MTAFFWQGRRTLPSSIPAALPSEAKPAVMTAVARYPARVANGRGSQVWLDGEDGLHAKKGNHGPRRMGHHGSIGNGADRAGAAPAQTPAKHPYGRTQEAS